MHQLLWHPHLNYKMIWQNKLLIYLHSVWRLAWLFFCLFLESQLLKVEWLFQLILWVTFLEVFVFLIKPVLFWAHNIGFISLCLLHEYSKFTPKNIKQWVKLSLGLIHPTRSYWDFYCPSQFVYQLIVFQYTIVHYSWYPSIFLFVWFFEVSSCLYFLPIQSNSIHDIYRITMTNI